MPSVSPDQDSGTLGSLLLAEELILVLLDKDSGALVPNTQRTVNLALAGGILMDLQLAGRIDTDLDKLMLVDATPVGHEILDSTLADIAESDAEHDAVFWVDRIASRGRELQESSIARLVELGILDEPHNEDFLALTPETARALRYPLPDGTTQEHAQLRIMRVLFSGEIPDPADVALICIVDACNGFPALLSPAELRQVRARIALFARMDLIGQAVSKLVHIIGPASVSEERAVARTWPAARGWPLVGNGLAMRRDIRAFLTAEFQRHGPIFRVRAFTSPQTVLAGREANLFLLRKQREHLSMGPVWEAFRKDLGARRFPLFGMDGPDHFRMRREMTSALSRSVIVDRLPDVASGVRKHIAGWPLDTPLPGFRTIQRIINDQIGELLTGMLPREYFDDINLYFGRLMMMRVILPVPVPFRTPRYRRARRRVLELCEKVLLDHQLSRRKGTPDLVDDLLALHRNDSSFMPEADLMLSTLLPFVVGLDTSSSIVASMAYIVLKHPDLQDRARAEADSLFAHGEPTAEGLRAMDVTHRIAMEVLRMYPVVPALRRTVSTSFDFHGYKIPVGEELLFGTTVTHYLPEYFPEPDRFDIDRYLPGREEHKQAGIYVPFGLGVHRCMGSGFAEAQIALTIATILHETVLELDPPDYELRLVPSPFPTPSKGFRFKMTRRRHSP